MTANIVYEGALRTAATHLRSGAVIQTDAPVDNRGRGEAFSPTDLVAAALGSCILTIMGIKARERGLNIDYSTVSVNKVMTRAPRRIQRLEVRLAMRGDALSAADRKVLEAVTAACPVSRSLHPDLEIDVAINWEPSA